MPQLGTKERFCVVMVDSDGEPVSVAKSDIVVHACPGGENSLKKVTNFSWVAMGKGCYSLLLPAACFQSTGEGIYIVESSDTLTWRDTYRVNPSRPPRASTPA